MKAAAQDSLLKIRFRRVRSEMDGLYHYRIKPAPFDPHWNPFRMPGHHAGRASREDPGQPPPTIPRARRPRQPQQTSSAPELGDVLLAHAIAGLRIGGVVTLGDTTQLTVDGAAAQGGRRLHDEGARARLVLIRIKHLSTVIGDPGP